MTSERTGLPGFGAGSPAIADLNGDGHLDLVASSNIADRAPVIYWGDGTRDYRPERSLSVPGAPGASNAEVADPARMAISI